MAKPCSVCQHPDRAQVEIGLANDIALRILAQKYGLSFTQLSKHRTNHMDEQTLLRLRIRGRRSDEELAQIRDIESKSLLDHLVWQRARLYSNADAAKAIGDAAGERAALAEAGRASERIGKLLGELGAHITINQNTVNLIAMPDYHQLRTLLVQALRPFPEVYPAAIAAFEQFEVARTPQVLEHQRVAA